MYKLGSKASFPSSPTTNNETHQKLQQGGGGGGGGNPLEFLKFHPQFNELKRYTPLARRRGRASRGRRG